MADAAENLNGPQRAAVFLLSIGEQEASEVLKHMPAKDVQKVGAAMAALENISKEQAEAVMENFTETVEEQTAIGVSTEDYIRKVLTNALGPEKASNLVNRILAGNASEGLETLKWLEPKAILDLIREEHPQIIAIVLSSLDEEQAAAVFDMLPERVRADVIVRIATLDSVQPSALRELDEILARRPTEGPSVKPSSVGGTKCAANILNLVDGPAEEEVMKQVREIDETLGQQIQDLMFVFDNLLEVDDRGIQTLLREIENEALTIALKGADTEMREKIFKNMSQRAAAMMAEDLEARGPVRLSDVEAAQKEILMAAQRLSETGAISLGGKGDEYV
ncbi:MAG: flagellar motor switch protein FliG [Gammaproteobacteria bacterium]|nr:flagellar motor switch protein FliG [Gammaproteobacteria bacterium]